jgi:hypothetical protein
MFNTKFYACGGMNYKVFTKLYECLVQPIVLHGSSIWGLTEQRLINNVQNRAAKIFLGVYKSDRSLYTLKSQDLRLCFDHTLILC